MATTAETLLLRIDATTEQLRREMQRAERTVGTASDKMTREVRRVDASFDRLNRTAGRLKGALGALGIGLSIRGLQGLTSAAIKTGDEIAKTAGRVGLTTDALQELRHAAQLSGVESRTFDMAMQRLTRRLGEAAQGSGELLPTLEKYNVAIRDSAGNTRATEEVLADLADTIARTRDPAEQLRIAFKAFDSEGAALVNMLRGGSAAMDAQREAARRLGLVIGADTLRKTEELNDQLTTMNAVMRTNFNEGLLRSLTDDMADLRDTVADPRFAEGFQALGSAVVGVMGWAADELIRFRQAFKSIEDLDPLALGRAWISNDPLAQFALRQFGADEPGAPGLEAFGGPGPDVIAAGQQEIAATAQEAATATKEAAAEAAKFQKALQALQDRLDPFGASLSKFKDDQALLDRALAEGTLSGAAHADMMDRLHRSYRDTLDPLGEINRELERERELIAMTAGEREVANRLLEIENQLRDTGMADARQVAQGYRQEIVALQQLEAERQHAAASYEAMAGAATPAFEWSEEAKTPEAVAAYQKEIDA